MAFAQKQKIPKAKCFVSIVDGNSTKDADLLAMQQFVKQVDAIVPARNADKISERIADLIHAYKITCPLRDIIRDPIMGAARNGTLACISEGHIDHEDVFSICNGRLILSLTKSTYERTGLQGQPSKLVPDRRIIAYDLNDAANVAGKKGFDRLIWALENTLTVPKLFYVSSMTALDAAALPSSAEKLRVSATRHVLEDRKLPALAVPVVENLSADMAKVVKSEWALELHEWAGMISLQSDQTAETSDIDAHLSSYEVHDSTETTDVVLFQFSGALFPSQWTQHLWQQLNSLGWAALTTFGYEDGTTAWKHREHTFHTGGENILTLFRLAGGSKACFQVVSGKDLQA